VVTADDNMINPFLNTGSESGSPAGW